MPYPRGTRINNDTAFFNSKLCLCGGQAGIYTDAPSYQALGLFNNSAVGLILYLWGFASGLAFDSNQVKIITGPLSANLAGTGMRAYTQGGAVVGQMYSLTGLVTPYATVSDFNIGGIDSQVLFPQFPFYALAPGQSLVVYDTLKTVQAVVTFWYLQQAGLEGRPV